MKKLSFFFYSVLFLYGASFGNEITKKYDFKDFTGVNLSHGMKVSIMQSDSYSVEITAEKEDLENIKVEKDGDALNFSVFRNRYNFKKSVRISIKMPSLTAIHLSGGSEGILSMDISSKSFAAGLSGGSELEGELNCGDIMLAISGGSEITLKGKGIDAEIAGSGSSTFNLKGFAVKNVNSQLSGGSNVEITMDGMLNTVQSGGSNLVYYGRVDLENTLFSGDSGIQKGD